MVYCKEEFETSFKRNLIKRNCHRSRKFFCIIFFFILSYIFCEEDDKRKRKENEKKKEKRKILEMEIEEKIFLRYILRYKEYVQNKKKHTKTGIILMKLVLQVLCF